MELTDLRLLTRKIVSAKIEDKLNTRILSHSLAGWAKEILSVTTTSSNTDPLILVIASPESTG